MINMQKKEGADLLNFSRWSNIKFTKKSSLNYQ